MPGKIFSTWDGSPMSGRSIKTVNGANAILGFGPASDKEDEPKKVFL